MTEIGEVGNASARLGQQLATTLTTPALKLEDLDAKLGGYVQTAESPGRARGGHRRARSAAPRPRGRGRGAQLPRERPPGAEDSVPGDGGRHRCALPPAASSRRRCRRLLASDVIWADSFKARAEAVAESEEVVGLEVPASEFVTADEVTTPEALAAIWQRIQGASDGGTPDRAPRKRDLVREGPSERAAPVRGHGDDDPGDRRPRVRGRRRGHGRQPGGPDQGHADDPEAARPDREDRDDPDHRPGRDEGR